MRTYTATELDPVIRATDLEKYEHVFAIGDRVRTVENGHTGKIINQKFGRWYVQLDSDKKHVIRASAWELAPETFPSASETAATGKEREEKMYRVLTDGGVATVDPVLRGGDVLQKSARSQFRVGQAVKANGRAGTIVEVTPGGLVEIRFGPNLTGLHIPADVVVE